MDRMREEARKRLGRGSDLDEAQMLRMGAGSCGKSTCTYRSRAESYSGRRPRNSVQQQDTGTGTLYNQWSLGDTRNEKTLDAGLAS